MSGETGYFYNFFHEDPEIVSKIVEKWRDKTVMSEFGGNTIYGLEYRTDRGSVLIGWAIYNLITTVATNNEFHQEYGSTIRTCIDIEKSEPSIILPFVQESIIDVAA